MSEVWSSRVNDYAFQLELIVLSVFAVKCLKVELLGFFFIIFQRFKVLQTDTFSELDSLASVRFIVQFKREMQPSMDFSVHKHIVVENDTLEMNEEDVWNF